MIRVTTNISNDGNGDNNTDDSGSGDNEDDGNDGHGLGGHYDLSCQWMKQ